MDLAEFDPEQPDDVLVDAPATYCEAWQHLPLHDLELNGQLPPFVMHHIGKVTRLTQLTLKRHKDSLDDLGSVAAPLQQLKLLQKLRIDWCRPGLPNSNTGFGSDEALSCVKALLQMRRLSDLCLQGFVLPWAAAQSFAELQHLTYLQLERCCLDDFHVNVIALHLTGGFVASLAHVHAQTCLKYGSIDAHARIECCPVHAYENICFMQHVL